MGGIGGIGGPGCPSICGGLNGLGGLGINGLGIGGIGGIGGPIPSIGFPQLPCPSICQPGCNLQCIQVNFEYFIKIIMFCKLWKALFTVDYHNLSNFCDCTLQ